MLEAVERCAGLDIHQKTVVACVMVGSNDSLKVKKEIKTFGTRTSELKELAQWLNKWQVTRVLLESTGQYWIPVWNILE